MARMIIAAFFPLFFPPVFSCANISWDFRLGFSSPLMTYFFNPPAAPSPPPSVSSPPPPPLPRLFLSLWREASGGSSFYRPGGEKVREHTKTWLTSMKRSFFPLAFNRHIFFTPLHYRGPDWYISLRSAWVSNVVVCLFFFFLLQAYFSF